MQALQHRTILTPASGYLEGAWTHTLNPYSGCSFAGAACGVYCYAQHNRWVTRGRPWGLYGAKTRAAACYRDEHDRERRAGRPLRLFMASSTDPWLPQEATAGVTRGVLEAMLDRPPDALLLQTRAPRCRRDLTLVRELAARTRVRLSMTIETDLERVPGLPPHASSPAERLEVLAAFRAAGVPTQAAVAPLLPLGDPDAFAAALDRAADRVVLDHWLIGDGSLGARTRRTGLVAALRDHGLAEWSELAALDRVRERLVARLGPGRVLVGQEGWNAAALG